MTLDLSQNMLLGQDYVFVDTETTGFNPEQDRIIEVGIVRVRQGEIVKTFKTLVNPERPVDKFTYELTGIQDSDLASAPKFRELLPQLAKLLQNSIFFAHNASFDYGFFAHEYARAYQQFGQPSVCTVRLSQNLYPGFGSHSLDTIALRHNITISKRHRALDDARATWKFVAAAKEELGESRVNQGILQVLAHPKNVVKRASIILPQQSLLG